MHDTVDADIAAADSNLEGPASACDVEDRVLAQIWIMLAAGEQAQCSFSGDGGRFPDWPGVSGYKDAMDGNYVALLVFAWAYILSACQVERLHSSSSVHADDDRATATGFQPRILYTKVKAAILQPKQEGDGGTRDADGFHVDFGYDPDSPCRWWAAPLASQAAGWTATFERRGSTFWSPWCYVIDGGPPFTLHRRRGVPG